MTSENDWAGDRYRILIDAITDYAIYMLDSGGFITSWNPGAERFKGYRGSEIIGQHFSRFYTERDKATGLPARALETARTEGRFENEGWRVRKDGTTFWAHVIIDPVFDPRTGELLAYAKITRDLTERKIAEENLQAAKDALYQSQKMESLGQLTGGVAHDFNNLLNAIIGSLELLRKPQPPERRESLIKNALAGAERGVALTQRMLAFARKQNLATAPVDVFHLIGGMTDLLSRSLGPTIEIEYSFGVGLKHALADPHQLELAIINLAVNARDAMPEGGSITISARNATPSDSKKAGLPHPGFIQISVADKGVGMDADTLARASEPFFTTKGVGKGTGLGLSMVSGTAEQLGGRLALTSTPGEGTTATIWLPTAEQPNLEVAPLEPAADHDTRALRVLAVDDDGLVLMNTIALLEDLGHDVMEANSGSEALAKLEAGEPVDVLVTDHAMPNMTGTQLIDEVSKRWPDIRIVLASGYAELEAPSREGVVMLAKPFWQSQLEATLADAMK